MTEREQLTSRHSTQQCIMSARRITAPLRRVLQRRLQLVQYSVRPPPMVCVHSCNNYTHPNVRLLDYSVPVHDAATGHESGRGEARRSIRWRAGGHKQVR